MTNRIKIAKTAGFCFGVKRAIQLAEKTAKEKGQIYTYGPLIHNPQEVKRLTKKGIRSIKSPWRLKNSTLIIRTHGISLEDRQRLDSKDISIVDATCPFVKRAQDIVKKLANDSSHVIIVGDKVHPEVVGLVSHAKGKCSVIKTPDDTKKRAFPNKIGVISQTTQSPKNFEEIINVVRKNYPKSKIYNTICRATVSRQSEAKEIAQNVDLMIVVGGKNSGNTRRLYEICKKYTKAKHIELPVEVKKSWFKGINSVGLTAGASTPDWIIRNVENTIKYIKEIR